MLTLDKATHTYSLDGHSILGVHEAMKLGGLDEYSNLDFGHLESARLFGTAAHTACEYHDRGQLDEKELDPALKPFLGAWRAFSGDLGVKFDPGHIEMLIYSAKLRFAGTLDRLTKIGNKWTIIDLKSTTTMMPGTGVQLAGYRIAVREMTGYNISQCWGVQLCPDGRYKIHDYDDPVYETTFRSLLNVARFKKRFNIKGGN